MKIGCLLLLPFCTLLWAALPLDSNAHTDLDKIFQVIKVKGTITNISNGQSLATNSRFSAEDTLQFSTDGDRLAVIDERKQSYIARPAESDLGYQLEPIRAKFNTRPGKILTYIEFKEYLENRDFLVLGEKAELKIEAENFPIDDDHFFFIRYRLEGEAQPINKKLPSEGQKAIINKKKLFQVDGQAIPPEKTSQFQLYYHNSQEKKSLKISEMRLIFPDETSLRQEIEVIRSSYGTSKTNRPKLRKAIENYLLEVYGLPEPENLERWLKRHYDL